VKIAITRFTVHLVSDTSPLLKAVRESRRKKMGDGSAGSVNQATPKGSGTVPNETVVDEQMMGVLKVPVQAGDNKGIQARFQKVRDLVDKMTPEHAGELLTKLNTKNSNDPLAKEIKSKFSDASVEQLKKDLAVKSGRATDSQTTDTKPSKTSTGADAKTKVSEMKTQERQIADDLIELLLIRPQQRKIEEEMKKLDKK
jgi:hypothetical protein